MERFGSDSTIVDALQSVAVPGLLDSYSLSKLATFGTVASFTEGTILFCEGQKHDQLYFVCSGMVRLDMLTPVRGHQTILTIGSGELVAWSSLVGDGTMTATAIATEDTVTVTVCASELKRALEEDHDFGYQIMTLVAKALSRRLLATRLQLLDLYLH